MSGRPVKHSVTLRGHRTSISLEDDFWLALRALAAEQDLALNALVSRIDADRGIEIGLASAIRVYVLRELQGRIPRAG